MLTLIYVIGMEFLRLNRRRSSARNVSSGVEQGKTAVFVGYPFTFRKLFVNGNNPCSNGRKLCGLDWLESRRVVPVFKFEILVETTGGRLACAAGVERGMGRKGKREGIGERGEGTFIPLLLLPSLFPAFALFSLSPPPPLFAPATQARAR